MQTIAIIATLIAISIIYSSIKKENDNNFMKQEEGVNITLHYPKFYYGLGLTFIGVSILWGIMVLFSYEAPTLGDKIGMLFFLPIMLVPCGLIMIIQYKNWKIILISESEFKYINTFKKVSVIKYTDIHSCKLTQRYITIKADRKIMIDRQQVIGLNYLIRQLNANNIKMDIH